MTGRERRGPAGWRTSAVLLPSIALAFGLTVIGVRSTAAADISALVLRLRALRDATSVDLSARMLATSPEGQRAVFQLRLRGRRVGSSFSVLVDVLDPPARASHVLLVHDATEIRVYAAGPEDSLTKAERTQEPNPFSRLSPCMGPADLIETHFWWPDQTLLYSERLNGRLVHVVRSRGGPATSTYREVTSWVDADRLTAIRARKTRWADGSVVDLSYDRPKEREGRWMPRRIAFRAANSTCRWELTVIGGTSNASLDVAIFDPARFNDSAPAPAP